MYLNTITKDAVITKTMMRDFKREKPGGRGTCYDAITGDKYACLEEWAVKIQGLDIYDIHHACSALATLIFLEGVAQISGLHICIRGGNESEGARAYMVYVAPANCKLARIVMREDCHPGGVQMVSVSIGEAGVDLAYSTPIGSTKKVFAALQGLASRVQRLINPDSLEGLEEVEIMGWPDVREYLVGDR